MLVLFFPASFAYTWHVIRTRRYIIMIRRLCRLPLLLLPGLCATASLADTLYKCVDSSGVVLYTNQKGGGRNCSVLSQDKPLSTVAPPRQAARNPTPAGFPRVSEDAQKGRDTDRRKILDQELAGEQQKLEQARKDLTEGEATRLGDERNYQKYLDRVQQLKDGVALHERNLEALRREIANLR